MSILIAGPTEHPVGQPMPNPTWVNTTSRSRDWSQELSPFYLGPVPLYQTAPVQESRNVENGWAFSKIYPEHIGPDGLPNDDYWAWAEDGWRSKQAYRYPMGKGRKPKYSYWAGEILTYIEARKKIYVPLYAGAVIKTEAFNRCLDIYKTHGTLTLWDFDGYPLPDGKTIKDVLNDPTRSMGHSFVLKYLLDKTLTKS